MIFEAALLLTGIFAGKTIAEQKNKRAPTVAGPHPFDAVCPVDSHMPPEFRVSTRNAWQTAPSSDLRTMAAQIRLEYPVAASTLYAKAEQLDAASRAEPAPAPAKVVEMRRSTTTVGGPANGAAPRVEEADRGDPTPPTPGVTP